MYRNDRLGKVSFNSPDRGLWGDHEAILKTHLEFRNGGGIQNSEENQKKSSLKESALFFISKWV